MGTRGQECNVESREKWKTRGSLSEDKTTTSTCSEVWADNFGHISVDREVGVHGERHYRRAAGPGHGAQARVVEVDKHLQR